MSHKYLTARFTCSSESIKEKLFHKILLLRDFLGRARPKRDFNYFRYDFHGKSISALSIHSSCGSFEAHSTRGDCFPSTKSKQKTITKSELYRTFAEICACEKVCPRAKLMCLQSAEFMASSGAKKAEFCRCRERTGGKSLVNFSSLILAMIKRTSRLCDFRVYNLRLERQFDSLCLTVVSALIYE